MRLIRLADAPPATWRNGGGTTREIVRAPEGSAGDDFAWRLSVAEVAAAGPFSRFDRCDRILVLLGGNGLSLEVAGETLVLDRPLAHLRFPGELPITARPVDGPTTDLNLIWRRDRSIVVMYEGSPSAPETLGGGHGEVVIAFSAVTGATRLGDPGEQLVVGSDDREVGLLIAPIERA